MANENFYAEVRFQGKSAVLLLTSEGQWSLRQEDSGFGFEKHGGRRGVHKVDYSTLYRFYVDGDKESRFSLTDLSFPPKITLEPRWLENKFNVGEKWAKALGYTGSTNAAWNTDGHWYAIATGPLMTWVEQYCAERTKELKQLAVSLGLNLGALIDPTGALSLAGAIEASTRGDYLGCTLNLVAVVPLLGKAAQAIRNTRIVTRMNALIQELKVLKDWLTRSKAILQRTRGMAVKGLEGITTAGRAVVGGKAITVLKNSNWIKKMDPKDFARLGILPKEAEVLQNLAKQGYYFVVRACNPERVAWLKWAADASCRMLAKPLWIKAKSLKSGNWKGLVGYKMPDKMDPSIMAKLMTKAEIPRNFNPQFLGRSAGKMKRLWKMEPGAMKKAFGVTDQAQGGTHFLVQTDDGYLILTDAKGAAYVSDFDVVLIQKELPSGAYGPPGMNVGPKGTPYKGGDNADLRPYWNEQFSRVKYPPGYEVIQHGEATGTAGVFKGTKADYEPAWDVKTTVWGPGDTWDTEQLIVAANAEGLPAQVGWTNGWNDLKAFHDANPMGDFRIKP